VMCGGSILSCCPRNPHGHERALKEEDYLFHLFSKQINWILFSKQISNLFSKQISIFF